LHIGDQTALEARPQTLFESRNRFRRFVAGDDHLLATLIERVEGVEKLLLRALLAGDELNVVDHQNVCFPVSRAKVVSSLLPNRGDEIVRELFRRHIRNLQHRRELERAVTDGMQQMRLAKTHTAVDEERVELSAGMFRYRNRCSMRKSIRGSDDIGAKDVFWIQPVATRRRQDHLFRAVIG